MDDYALVMNAGSSSLKFCVFQRPAGSGWRYEARGQIEGIGTSPRMTVKGENGHAPAADALSHVLPDHEHLLDLNENSDHLIYAVATDFHRLQNRCPSLRILATSREALGAPMGLARIGWQ